MSRLKKINDKANEIVEVKFKELLVAGNWPELQYKKETELGGESFLLFEYSHKRSQFVKTIHDKLVAAGIEFGMWENKRNAAYFDAVSKAVAETTVEEVDSHDRFKTWCD